MVFPKQMTLEKVEDLRLDMIQKKKKSALIKLISIYKDRNQPLDNSRNSKDVILGNQFRSVSRNLIYQGNLLKII